MIQVSASIYENPGLGGLFTLVTTNTDLITGFKNAGDLLTESKTLRPKPNLIMALDVSGSMKISMPQVVATSLAAVDALENGSMLSIMTFDYTVTPVIFFLGTLDATEKVCFH